MKTVALVSAREAMTIDTDLPLLTRALHHAGVTTKVVAWDDATAPWASFDLAVVRSAWDYVPRRDEFIAWARALPCPLRNEAAVLAWNTDKRYLRELAHDHGIGIVPTRWIEQVARLDDAADTGNVAVAEHVVVKPAISAGAKDTAVHAAHERDDIRAHVVRILESGRTAMVQPFVNSIATRGETGLLFFGGELSHAIRKGPILTRDAPKTDVVGLFAGETITAVEPSPEERRFAERVLSVLPFAPPLYARVDVAEGPNGPMLLELELTEPSVFLETDAQAAARFADAIVSAM